MTPVARKPYVLSLVIVLVAVILPACAAAGTPGSTSGLQMMSMEKMPAEVQAAPSVVQQAYQFAAANPDLMKQIPCYCGCGSIGHTSNYSCYVQSGGQGSLAFDDHALGCSLCVNITQDAMRMTQEGKRPPEIKAYVDATYAKYGTSNMP